MPILRIKQPDGTWIEIPSIGGKKGDPFTYEDFTPEQLEALKGEPGVGIQSIARTAGNGAPGTFDTYTVTLTDGGTYPIQVYNGTNGKDGTSLTVSSVTESTEDSGTNIVNFSDGKKLNVKNGSKGIKGDKGDPYTLTDTDKNTIAAAVKASLTKENWTFTLEDGSTVTKAVYVG